MSTKEDDLYDEATKTFVWFETISPSRAKEMLADTPPGFNIRGVSPLHVANIAADAQTHGFEFNGDPIRIDPDSRVVDGQHRLHAIVKSKLPLRCLVVQSEEFLRDSVLSTIDTSGLMRNISQLLKHKGASSPHLRAAIARWMLLFERGPDDYAWKDHGPKQENTKSSVRERQDWVVANEDVLSWVVPLVLAVSRGLHCSTTALGTVAILAAETRGRPAVESFYRDLASPTPRGNPIALVLRETLWQRRFRKNNTGPVDGRFTFGAASRALGAYLLGRKLIRIQAVKRGTNQPVDIREELAGSAP